MIKLVDKGDYRILKSKYNIKILTLHGKEKRNLTLIKNLKIGEIAVANEKLVKKGNIFASGKFRLYRVKGEEDLTEFLHLELCLGQGDWQGYILPIGFPTGIKKRIIISTNKIITRSVV